MNRNQQYKLKYKLGVIECNISIEDESEQLTEGFIKL